ncbi:MAG: VOC family protein [Proteobacteria bacterium]|nr:VOC family protein [Burkholderiales bacterium]
MKLRHIALSVPDVAAAQKFFEDAFSMTKAGDAQNGVYMTDGTMNVALLNKHGKVDGIDTNGPFYGVMHFGMWVDDLEQAEKQVTQAGASYLFGRPTEAKKSFYEVKYKDPSGIVFDVTASGWKGAVKNVKPVE